MKPLYTPEDKIRIYGLSEQGLILTYAFCENIIAKGKVLPLAPNKEVQAIRKAGINYLPLSFFVENLGAKQVGEALTLGEKTFYLYENKENIPPIEKNGVTYLPAVVCARTLGVSAKLFCNEKMTAFGPEETLNAIDADLADAASFLIYGEYPTSFTPEEFAQGRKAWRDRTVGNAETNDVSNPMIAKKLAQIDAACQRQLDSMNLQPDATILFGEMRKPIESDELSKLYDPLWAMARAYGTYGCKFYKNPDLREKIRYGMQWGYEHMYGEAEITNTGWRDVNACNWWYWMVGAPDPITDILITMDDEFTMEEKQRYLKLFVWFLTWRCNTDKSAMTRVVVCTKTALILEKSDMMFASYLDYNHSIRVGMGTAMRIDYCAWDHAMPYNVGYGKLKLDRSLYVAANLAGSPMQYRSPRTYNIFDMLQFCFGPAIYRCQAYLMLHGRNTHITESSTGARICVDCLNMLGLFGEEEDAFIKAFVRRNAATETLAKQMQSWCALNNCKDLAKILQMPMPEPLRFAYAWFTGDRITQHRHDYAIGISMNSSREQSYESILDMNKMGWYTTDGATFYYTAYDEGQYDGENFLFNPEVAHRIPGTTEDVRPREARSIISNAWHSPTPYAGSITISDQFGMAAMEYVSEHFEGPVEENTSGYGGSRGLFDNDLFANKAWFTFDNELVCLGSAISSTMHSEIKTSIEHRRIVMDESREIVISVKGERLVMPKENYEKRFTGVDYIYMEGHGGFVLDKAATVYIRRYTSPECTGQSFIEFGYSHGADPVKEKYQYTVLLAKDEAFVKAYAATPACRVLAHTETILAAESPAIGLAGYAFYKPESCNGIATDQGLIVITEEKDGITELRVSDVTQLLTEATVTVEGVREVLDASDTVKAEVKDGKLTMRIDFTDSYGRPYFVKFKKA